MSLSVSMCVRKNTIIARLHGEMDEASISDFRIKINDIIKKYDITNIIFNFKHLSFMDSSGIGLIIGRYNQVIKKRGQIVLCEMNKQIEKIISLSGLLRICTLRENEESAKYYLECA